MAITRNRQSSYPFRNGDPAAPDGLWRCSGGTDGICAGGESALAHVAQVHSANHRYLPGPLKRTRLVSQMNCTDRDNRIAYMNFVMQGFSM